MTAELAARYGFTPEHVWPSLFGFSAPLTQAMIAGLRCEPAVKSIEQNGYGQLAQRP